MERNELERRGRDRTRTGARGAVLLACVLFAVLHAIPESADARDRDRGRHAADHRGRADVYARSDDDGRGRGRGRGGDERTGGISVDDAVGRVLRMTGGQVLSVRQDDRGGVRVRVLSDDGRVRTYYVDAGGGVRQSG